MKARIQSHRGSLLFVFFDSKGQGLPIEIHRGAWRISVYHAPSTKKEA
jgi:hypothetical protein